MLLSVPLHQWYMVSGILAGKNLVQGILWPAFMVYDVFKALN